MISTVANHLWQSTVFAVVAGLLAWMLRRNSARVRYSLWMAASIKFLVPMSLLVAFGSSVEPWTPRPFVPPMPAAVDGISQPFSAPSSPPGAPAPSPWTGIAIVWAVGVAVVVRRRWIGWRVVRSAARSAQRLPVDAPVPVMSAPVRLEPGVIGLFRPVLLLPATVLERLTAAQLDAILAHELCHVRRRDNLTAAIHMIVETLFWFHPLVWWIGARLVDERESACDEEVLYRGSDPVDYAEGIARVCRLCLESPLPCAAGVTGADLKQRVHRILSERALAPLSAARKALLVAAAATAIVGPFAIGVLRAPLLRAQTAAEPALRFAVATVKPTGPSPGRAGMMPTPGGGFRAEGITLRQLVLFAYDLQEFQLSGGPSWIDSDGFQIVAKPETEDTPQDTATFGALDRTRIRMRTLLTDRFGLVIHKAQKETQAYFLTVAKGGHKLQPTRGEGNGRMMRSATQLDGNRAGLRQLVALLSHWLGRPVIDRTGLTGAYDFKVTYASESSPGFPAGPPPEPAADAGGPSIFTALQEQLGLKLESSKGPVEVVVIDRVSKPTAN
jgi:bla regulator protein blaR1